MRELLINRIEELWPFYTTIRLDPKSSRFADIKIDGVHISKLDLNQLDDKKLMELFERFIRQCQKQM